MRSRVLTWIGWLGLEYLTMMRESHTQHHHIHLVRWRLFVDRTAWRLPQMHKIQIRVCCLLSLSLFVQIELFMYQWALWALQSGWIQQRWRTTNNIQSVGAFCHYRWLNSAYTHSHIIVYYMYIIIIIVYCRTSMNYLISVLCLASIIVQAAMCVCALHTSFSSVSQIKWHWPLSPALQHSVGQNNKIHWMTRLLFRFPL